MAEAISLASQGCFTSTPNPRVGCVIVANQGTDNEIVVGRGWHRRAGEAHAEVVALREAGERAKGSTAYVTLEPCCVTGHTGPCTEALIAAGISRVVYAMSDPNPDVDGRGEAALKKAGIATESGVLGEQATALNKGFVKRMKQGLPWVMAKTASSLDGRSAMASGESQWITSAASRHQVQRLRAASCAIVTGVGTILADDPSMAVRESELGSEIERQPVLVVVDSQLRTPVNAAIFARNDRQVIIVTTESAMSREGSKETVSRLQQTGAEVHAVADAVEGGGSASRVCLNALLELLGSFDLNEVMLECGPTLLGAFLHRGLVDEIAAFIAPKIMGSDAQPMAFLNLTHLKDAPTFRLIDVQRFDDDILVGYQKAGFEEI